MSSAARITLSRWAAALGIQTQCSHILSLLQRLHFNPHSSSLIPSSQLSSLALSLSLPLRRDCSFLTSQPPLPSKLLAAHTDGRSCVICDACILKEGLNDCLRVSVYLSFFA
ncbi:hypothetical protein MPTK1_5g20160 [Marchantia polymorpha subsp. ruderalis]|uniref:Uncharacterized protein n=2 Tax=Marchantia polymorpha TaxID=3197 RepID=A0AAF6BKB6_MARPO|nr:hypothetical protein MARPO_0190s0012 [Marchantia polymorpha]BBN12450.1 hypothetical protein Mp_5g20160 [Marchantia polymorpha subsp. ruderalis]|eukprot:PTQ27617.1 hypothetical protein MARPO_0190s0012 [Marchantia polymorpha]